MIADSLECHGVLTKVTDEAFEFIKKHTLHGATITGLKRKEFAFRFRATISLLPEQDPELDEMTQRIRAALSTPASIKSGLSSQQIADEVGLTTRAIRARMTALAQRGLVTAVGRSERDPQRKYFWSGKQGTRKDTRKHSTS